MLTPGVKWGFVAKASQHLSSDFACRSDIVRIGHCLV